MVKNRRCFILRGSRAKEDVNHRFSHIEKVNPSGHEMINKKEKEEKNQFCYTKLTLFVWFLLWNTHHRKLFIRQDFM